MEQNQKAPQLSVKNEYELKRQKKTEEQNRKQKTKTAKQILKVALIALIAGGGIAALGWYIVSRPQAPVSDIISKNGIHWHPELTITVKGQKQEIPANIGIGVTHQPMHTHDATGVIHLEMAGRVTKDDIKLGKFFRIWDKQFNSNCVFDSCNGSDGKVKILVNGQENTEFENYQMQDKDKIEIIYE